MFFAYLLVSLSAFASSAFASSAFEQKITSSLFSALEKGDPADVIVYFGRQPDLAYATRQKDRTLRIKWVYDQLRLVARQKQSAALTLLRSEGVPHRRFHLVNAIAIPHASKLLLTKLAALPDVQNIKKDELYALSLPTQTGPLTPHPTSEATPGNLKSIGADRVWEELKVYGDGIVIAGQDTGFFWQHPAIKAKYRGVLGLGANHNFNWHNAIHRNFHAKENVYCSPDSAEPCDDTGHGTHTMGSMLGDDGGENRIGVAPGATWIGCRNMDRGVGSVSTYLECLEFFLAPYPQGGNPHLDGRPDLAPHIVNNSWACPPSEGCNGNEFLESIRALKAAGIMVIAAAGNEGPGCGSVSQPPGTYSGELLSVAALDHRNGEAASFSSRGPSSWHGGLGANLSAPGVAIRSAVPRGGLGEGGLYDYKSGTSMASPHVAGVVALLWSAKPHLVGKVNETVDLLQRSASGMQSSQSCGAFPGDRIPNAVFGYGSVNAYRALKFMF